MLEGSRLCQCGGISGATGPAVPDRGRVPEDARSRRLGRERRSRATAHAQACKRFARPLPSGCAICAHLERMRWSFRSQKHRQEPVFRTLWNLVWKGANWTGARDIPIRPAGQTNRLALHGNESWCRLVAIKSGRAKWLESFFGPAPGTPVARDEKRRVFVFSFTKQ